MSRIIYHLQSNKPGVATKCNLSDERVASRMIYITQPTEVSPKQVCKKCMKNHMGKRGRDADKTRK